MLCKVFFFLWWIINVCKWRKMRRMHGVKICYLCFFWINFWSFSFKLTVVNPMLNWWSTLLRPEKTYLLFTWKVAEEWKEIVGFRKLQKSSGVSNTRFKAYWHIKTFFLTHLVLEVFRLVHVCVCPLLKAFPFQKHVNPPSCCFSWLHVAAEVVAWISFTITDYVLRLYQ